MEQREVSPCILDLNVLLSLRTDAIPGLISPGNEHDYLRLSLKDGRVSLAVQLGSGSPFDTSIRPAAEASGEGRKKGVRFDDNEWHHVRVERRSSEVRRIIGAVIERKVLPRK